MRFSMPLAWQERGSGGPVPFGLAGGANCGSFVAVFLGVNPRILYKWLRTLSAGRGCGTAGPFAPAASFARRTEPELEAAMPEVGGRTRWPGGRKIATTLVRQGVGTLAFDHHRDPAPQRGPSCGARAEALEPPRACRAQRAVADGLGAARWRCGGHSCIR